MRFNGVPQWRIEWSQVRQVAVEITVAETLGYAEAFWRLTGEGVDFGCPVALVMGAEAFQARVFAFPGFDYAAYRQAREAEVASQRGRFICWQAGRA